MSGLPVPPTRHQSPRARPSGTRTLGFVGAAMLFALIGSAQDKPAAPPSPPPDNKPAEFVGSTTCQMCHEDIFNAFQKNPHQLVETDKKRGWDTKACESCHGPGSKHAESASAADIRQPAKLTPGEARSGEKEQEAGGGRATKAGRGRRRGPTEPPPPPPPGGKKKTPPKFAPRRS